MQGRLLSRKQVSDNKREEIDLYVEGYGADN